MAPKILIAIFAIFSFLEVRGQHTSSKYSIPKVEDLVRIPPSPEAQAFAKYGNTPVNIYSGTPSIAIPIASLKGRDIEVPISLTYDASGVKVEQIATWVGLGWNLNVGGMITRQVNGLPDDYYSSTPSYYPFYHSSVAADFEFVRNFTPTENSIYSQGLLSRYFEFMYQVTRTNGLKYEVQPDTYSLSVLGLSGTLFIDYTNNTAYCIESPEIKATPIMQLTGPLNLKLITGWVIVDGSGNTYYFDSAEKTYAFDGDENGQQVNRVYNSAWVLTKVESKNKRDAVDFNYTPVPKWEQPQLAGRGTTRNDFLSNSACGVDEMITSAQSTYQIEQMELSSIIVNSITRAEFTTFLSRNDLIGKKSLNQILIRDANGSLVNTYKFNQSYFGSPSTVEKELRLRLDSLLVFGNTSLAPQRYKFSYIEGNLPSRESMAQDYWGYYNGQANTTLIPYNYDLDFGSLGFIGANRRPSFVHASSSTLNKIQYPTGGATEFVYQPHHLSSSSFSSTDKEDYLLGGASLTGGTDPTDPLRYLHPRCDDRTTLAPKGIEQTFYVASAGTYKLNLNITNSDPNGNPTNHYFFIALYYTGLDGSQTRSFCDILNNGNVTYTLSNAFSQDYSLNQPITLQNGYYSIMILNTISTMEVGLEIFATRTVTSTTTQSNGAGLRLLSSRDLDSDGSVVSSRYYYYGDLRNVPPATITEGFISTPSSQTVGTLHADINFEEERSFEEVVNGFATTTLCTSIFRYSSNRTQSNYFITYPIVSEVSFDRVGSHNGYTVTRFVDKIDNHIGGFSKKNVLNGKVIQKWVFDKNGGPLTQERNYYRQDVVVPGTIGFYFSSNKTTVKDVTVKAIYTTPNEEFYSMENPQVGGSLNHCGTDGIIGIPMSDANYHTSSVALTLTGQYHVGYSCAQISLEDPTFPFNPNHPARIKFNQFLSEGIPDVSTYHANTSGMVLVLRRVYVIPYCRYFGQQYKKNQYLFSRWWPKLDSTVSVQYSGSDSLLTYTKNLYENNNHFQITKVRQADSKGVIRVSKLFYPHELQTLYPAEPWSLLVAQNRITEPARVEGTIGNNVPDFVKQTRYQSSIVNGNSIIVPSKVQFSSGVGPLEDRIRYHLYDLAWNPIEVSRESDTRTSFIWGYNKQFPIAEVKNASINEIFHTSFEAGEEGGNSVDGDSRTGLKSKTGGYSKNLTGLTPNKAYVLTYWQKVSNIWTLQTVNITASSSTTYDISITGQVDEVRFHPKGAIMSTYTHKPGIGVTTTTDANNQTTFYEYDSFSRLHLMKDESGRILKTFQYNYYKP